MSALPHFTRRAFVLGATLAATAGPLSALAQDYPSKPITLIVPYAAGGSSDTRARQLGEKLAALLGKAVVVDNKPGGNGNIGTDAIARATPDGHTIGIGNLAPLAVNKTLFPKLSYDPQRDLVPVALIEKGPLLLVVSADKSPHKSLKDLIAASKASPGKLSYASAGSGGSFHLAGETFNIVTGTDAAHIPYRGGGPAANDLLGGTVDYMFEMAPAAMGYLKSSPPRMRALAVAHDKRLASLPDVPTFAELGIQDMVISNWFGVVAPKGTPPAIVARLNQAINQALQAPDLARRITDPGNVIGGGTPEDFAALIASEAQRWGQLIKARGIRPD
ncbi:Bug family tripartite tricarboxylate transporter substrate binding protein [Azohydromonas lata]|uniref:Tripartite tricarboxylate transporter substrate binding protein n=1 Tax=Azohydromonas lata TaxID=45677 RepID=A0ABU5IH36_9BURK|nr:tripartite tricarboxylate transporter substrate binding protein [Azohydromonas lata]MDZ5458455.1 tripartite tricarboxylate transporter substrate binding protein [Azohydromonas lata]